MDDILTMLECAQAAVETYTSLSGYHGGDVCDIIDLVADLMHFAKHHDLDPISIISQAQQHFSAEAAPAQDTKATVLRP
jgi:hypothetical protein